MILLTGPLCSSAALIKCMLVLLGAGNQEMLTSAGFLCILAGCMCTLRNASG